MRKVCGHHMTKRLEKGAAIKNASGYDPVPNGRSMIRVSSVPLTQYNGDGKSHNKYKLQHPPIKLVMCTQHSLCRDHLINPYNAMPSFQLRKPRHRKGKALAKAMTLVDCKPDCLSS